jgi:hypothetical protein
VVHRVGDVALRHPGPQGNDHHLTGTVELAGDMWFEAFATPWLARVTPVVFTADRSGSSPVTAWLVSMILFSLGWILFGLASLRARVFPRTLSVAVAVGGLIGFQAAMPPWGLALGLAVAAVGIWLVRQDRQEGQVQPDSQRVPPEPPRVNRSPHLLPMPSPGKDEHQSAGGPPAMRSVVAYVADPSSGARALYHFGRLTVFDEGADGLEPNG